MSLQFIAKEALVVLERQIESNLEHYKNGRAQELVRAADCRTSKIETVLPPNLQDSEGNAVSDAEGTRRIYQWLSSLTPVQAADPRLWTYLTHYEFPTYIDARWGGGIRKAKNPVEVIRDRWFFKGTGSATFMRNGISRLWWFGHLTYDETRPDPFELTDRLLSLQDIQVAFLERSIGRCRPLLRTALETIGKLGKELRDSTNKGAIIQGWAKDLHMLGGGVVLELVPLDRLRFLVETKLRSRLGGDQN